MKEIINAKENLGRNFKSIFDFCINVDTRIVNKRALEGLILAGAFDTLHKNRAQLFNNVEMILEFAHKYQNSKLLTTDSLFGGIEEIQISEPKLPEVKPWTDKEQLSLERKVVGFYITDHPLRKYETEYSSFATIHLGETENIESMDSVRACGVITELKTKIDKSGNNMAFFKLDDFTGSCECIMFSKTFDEYGKYVREDEPVLAIGNLESSGDAVKIHINKIIPMEKVSDELTESVRIIIDKEKVQPEKVSLLKNVFQKNEGSVPVFISIAENGTKGKLFAIDNFRVKVNESFVKKVTKLLGEDSITLKSK